MPDERRVGILLAGATASTLRGVRRSQWEDRDALRPRLCFGLWSSPFL